jgi:hypothetical protein
MTQWVHTSTPTDRRRPGRGAVSLALAASIVASIHAAELQRRTSDAYDAYLHRARQTFVGRLQQMPGDVAAQPHGPSAAPAHGDGIIDVPGGLVHHWEGGVFIEDVSLDQAVGVSTAYSSYSTIYANVMASQLLEHDRNTYRVHLRLRESEAGIKAVLDVTSTVTYFFPEAGEAYSISNADEIREVTNAGTNRERLLPAGSDSGYLWRGNTFTRYLSIAGGVYVEIETLGLSRRFPPLLGWIIEPIARRLGRRSVVNALQEYAAALRHRNG